ncbi:MAG: hypothetical protein KJZ78_06700 [Bryobacteraceae bacterium]|nr:hypothetical protein [Bryobacteraceae bacterium]
MRAQVKALHAKGVVPFHWEIEFPEVFRNGGFDVIVGNPPFAGKNTLTEAHAEGYMDWLKALHEQSHGNSDLVAHFFRRAFTLLRPDGCFGLIATNTIGQGDTRSTGLRWICMHGGTIYHARKRLRWPGQAAVVVSVVHVAKGKVTGPYLLDSREVPIITAYLFHAGGHEDPAHLKANEDESFQGSIVLGMGFTFDNTDKKGVTTSMKDDLRYTPSDCFETFPLPRNLERHGELEKCGSLYYDFRAELMQRENKGLTTIYNWFHDPEFECSEVLKLRDLHDAMDRVVLDAYGWTDLRPACEFIPEFEDEDDDEGNGRQRRKKYRYRWPDEVRDEVLARLLELNRQRALEEGQLPTAAPVFAGSTDEEPKAKRRKNVRRPTGTLDQGILSLQEEEA